MLVTQVRGWAIGVVGLAGMLVPAQSLAQTESASQRCATKFEEGQRLRKDGKLKAASEALIACSQQECPEFIAKECTSLYTEAQASLPSVIVSATDAQGQSVLDVTVQIDGQPLVEQLDGRAIAIDPGMHVFQVERAGSQPVIVKALVAEGEKNKLVTAKFDDGAAKTGKLTPADEPLTLAPKPAPSKVPAILIGGLGLAAIGAGTALHFMANSAYEDAKNSCSPDCTDKKVDSIDQKYLFSEIAWGVGGAAVVTSAVLLIVQSGSSQETPPTTTAWSVGPVGAFDGVGASYRTRF
jgi:hypothetical protein